MSKYNDYVPQPLAVYKEFFPDDRTNQNYNLCQCNGDLSTWKLVLLTNSDFDTINTPTFHIKRVHMAGEDFTVTLKSIDGLVSFPLTGGAYTVNDLDDPVTYDAIVFLPTEYTDVIDHTPGTGFHLEADIGYYLVITDGSETWYTEVFYLAPPAAESAFFPAGCDSACEYISLSWSNSACIISQTIHNNTAAFSLFLPVNIAQPKYEYKPEQEDDGEGGSVTTFQRLEKRWEFFIQAPEYIADALAAVQMFSNVTVDFQNGDFIICRNVQVEVEWETACFAKITFRFTGDFLVKTMCC